ncbi:two-component system response regulator [Photobacterium proteolyticum]|uniref:Two-component system response regulator n=1 Tax=Photobacterium proteolyticum TaxID=1903952 RepID=A0A1Q9GST1_9GAMM|nr:response regulator transcription factor [Photobacterium proteolyticum]OLQ77763.1 two-component system response regulator [Photobacterium proteolyticum]
MLLVEDDLDLATAVVDYLELESIQCDHAVNGVVGLNLIKKNPYQAIILDLNLPRMDGLTVCRQMRELGNDTPVLMLTARDSLDDKLVGFDSGADDYLVKPFAMEELIARVKVLSRRRSGQINKLTVEDLELDLSQKQAYRNQQLLKLSPTAIKILEVLMRESPSPVSREVLMQRVWGDEQPDSNSLKVHVFNIRKQLDMAGGPPLIHTMASFGFVLRRADENQA